MPVEKMNGESFSSSALVVTVASHGDWYCSFSTLQANKTHTFQIEM